MVHRKSLRGQVLVLTALTISLAILSTQAYVYKRNRGDVSANWDALSDYILSIEQGSRHVVIASLNNVSNGGAPSNLKGNLDRWESLVMGDYQYGRCDLNATAASQMPYSEGVQLDWGIDGKGVSSASVDFILNLSGRGAEIDMSYKVNITTTALVSGSFVRLGGNMKQVTVILELLNEGESALAESIDLAYRKEAKWWDPSVLESYSRQDFGNGTYLYTFNNDILGNQVTVRFQAYDRRTVFVQVEAILLER
jgi:hypothetical protein